MPIPLATRLFQLHLAAPSLVDRHARENAAAHPFANGSVSHDSCHPSSPIQTYIVVLVLLRNDHRRLLTMALWIGRLPRYARVNLAV